MANSESDSATNRSATIAPERWALLVLLVIVLAAYFPTLNAGFIWDDDRYVTNNRLLAAPDGLLRIWFSQDSPSQYVPLTYTSFWLEHSLWGLWAKGYHIVNVLLHAANAILLWQLLRRLAIPGAWFAAALFALHPVQVESVAWISERKNVLSLLFCLLSVRSWLQFIEAPESSAKPWYRRSLIFHALALASKATACTLPAALVVVLWLKGKSFDRRRLKQILPFVALGIGMGLIAMWWEKHHQGTDGDVFAMSWPERILVACRAVWFYPGKLIWPVDLTFIYPTWKISMTDPWAYIWVVAFVAAAVTIYLARRKTGKGLGIAALFYVAMLSPLLGFIMLYTFRYTFVADHYQYVASIGPLTLLAAGLTKMFERTGKRSMVLQMVAGGALLLTLGSLTWRQSGIYQDRGTLWRDTLAKNPTCWMAENNLGNYLAQQHEMDAAMVHYERALKIKPDYAEAHYNMADVFARQGRLDEAIQHLEAAVRINPDYAKARNNLGIALLQSGRSADAVVHFQQAAKLRPRFVAGYVHLAYALDKAGRRTDAIDCLNKALSINSNDKEARQLLESLMTLPVQNEISSTNQNLSQ